MISSLLPRVIDTSPEPNSATPSIPLKVLTSETCPSTVVKPVNRNNKINGMNRLIIFIINPIVNVKLKFRHYSVEMVVK